MQSRHITTRKVSPRSLWFDRLMAFLALANLGLVLFDLSYVPARDLYLRGFWTLGRVYEPLKDINFYKLYDPYKGIEPHRDTQQYLETVDQLKEQVASNGLDSPQAETVLQRLRELSGEMIDQNHFQIADKTGTLETIKNRMRRQVFGNRDASSKDSFRTFWSQQYLTQQGWNSQIAFFDRQIEPLIATNYYRSLGENGKFIDRFWKIDRWFIGLFLIEFIARTWWLSRRHTGLRWIPDAMLLRWYDIFLLLPFWRWLRVIPVVIRLNNAKFPDLEPLRTQLSRVFVASFAEELTEVVVIQAIDQLQGAVERGEIARSLLHSSQKRYIDINNTNEIEVIAKRLLQVTLCKALPEVQTDVEALLRHNLEHTLNQLPVYQQLQRFPGVGHLPSQLTEQLVAQVSKLLTEMPQSAYTAIANAPPDPIAAKLSDRLVEHFSDALRTELQQQQTLEELQTLVSDLLEEIKINYVKRTPETDPQHILQQTQQLRRLAGR
ncbi:MAG: hypothetical protein KME19_00285 [Microcoleus vaginatus WJT46-NPBG5]|nr:hypothetical protein [Microcoleus vaginatus WJT46-NPBG5]